MTEVEITTEYIALGQFLKLSGCIDTGGAAKFFLQEAEVKINGEADNRRGRKLYSGDRVEIKGHGLFTVVKR
ncbi:S4 domain-containing protein YaaA [Paenibacillus sepulcri]|uniref:S4 domain-containing protein YaaA n=1 Tax=Paenibacillus sepulcri TaxID=359917 RepID=A0ABS7BVD0_9BACL|nr:S4 domain-containing protein YaaA [Paenibacillus sepulcri]